MPSLATREILSTRIGFGLSPGAFASSGAAPAATISSFSDAFTGSGALESHTPDSGGLWYTGTGGNSLSGDGYVYRSASPGAYWTPIFSIADYHADMAFRVKTALATDQLTLYLRFVDSLNYYSVTISQAGAIALNVTVAGSTTSLGTASVAMPAFSNRTLSARVVGSAISVYYEGSLVISVTDTTFASAGRCGIKVGHASTTSQTTATGLQIDSLNVSATPLSQPASTSAPTISGTGRQGQTLTATDGGWSLSPTITRQWQRSTDGGVTWSDISGATSLTYVVVQADNAKYLRFMSIANATSFAASTPMSVAWSMIDYFTDATDNVNLTAHTADSGATWTKTTGFADNILLHAGEAYGSGASNFARYYNNATPPSANYRVVLTVDVKTNIGYAAAMIRCSNSNQAAYLAYLDAAAGTVSVQTTNTSGTVTALGSTYTISGGLSTGTHTLEINASGTTINAVLDGVTVVTTTDSSVTQANKPGMRLRNSTSTTGVNVDKIEAYA